MKGLNYAGEVCDKPTLSPGLEQGNLQEARILIVSENDSLAERLGLALSQANFVWERTRSMAAACKAARSGQFPVMFTTPLLADGSWRQLVDIAAHSDSGCVVILVASTFDIQEWAEALEYGAFDVLDALHELGRVGECVERAGWAAYLKGAVQPAESANHRGTRGWHRTGFWPARSPN